MKIKMKALSSRPSTILSRALLAAFFVSLPGSHEAFAQVAARIGAVGEAAGVSASAGSGLGAVTAPAGLSAALAPMNLSLTGNAAPGAAVSAPRPSKLAPAALSASPIAAVAALIPGKTASPIKADAPVKAATRADAPRPSAMADLSAAGAAAAADASQNGMRFDGNEPKPGDGDSDVPGGASGASGDGDGGDENTPLDEARSKSRFLSRAPYIETNYAFAPNVTYSNRPKDPIEIAAVRDALATGGYVVLTSPRDQMEGGTENNHFPVAALAKVISFTEADEDGRVTYEAITLRNVVISGYRDGKIKIMAVPAVKRDFATETFYAEQIKHAIEGLNPKSEFSNPKVASAVTITDSGKLVQRLMTHFEFSEDPMEDLRKKQNVLAELSIEKQLKAFAEFLIGEVDLKPELEDKMKAIMSKSQREYFLRTQIKAANEELGNDKDPEVERLQATLAQKRGKMSAEAVKAAEAELNKASGMSGNKSSDYHVSVNYVDRLLSLPWGIVTAENGDLALAEKILNEDHHGLDEIKDRVLEFLAIRKVVPKGKGVILALDGPPGVGKTSLGRSIARALGLKFQRISLGGVRDESEIRGHRRTYVGALYGKIMDAMIKSGVDNPAIQLDEIDKMSSDEKGDPAAAMLEVLDPEQNNAFRDHYLDVAYDLSNVFFMATSNDRSKIPGPLRDRMEIIQLGSYTEAEKAAIAQGYLVRKQAEANGIPKGALTITPAAILAVIRGYTREGGVRNLEREIGKIARKAAARRVRTGAEIPAVIDVADVEGYLGTIHYDEQAPDANGVGQATGLAVTSVGGDVLAIETLASPKGTMGVPFKVTGQLREVMQESAQLALVRAKLWATENGVPLAAINAHEISLHVPDGSTPKDGPSAGITMLTAIASRLTGRAVRQGLAMTGELTLSGKVTAIGGLKEKSLAALRLGYKEIIISKENEKDLKDLPADVLEGIKFHIVTTGEQVLAIALEKEGTPLKAPERKAAVKPAS